MRPLALELEGFGAFRDPVRVDFADADLFAIVGATGHGKSTLIDAICFALYGKVPRHPKGEIAPVMTLGVNETKVSFTFEIAGSTFVATRVLRRDGNGKVQTKGRRFERMAGEMPELLGATEKEVEAAVQQHVGLDFGQFTKCVVLPQGDFAAFLHASAGDRVAILSALLDLGRYDRMGAAARERAKVAGARVGALTDERARIGDATEEQLHDARERRDALVSLRADVDASAPRNNELARATAEAQGRARAARTAAVALAAVAIPEAARTLAARIATAQADAEAAADAADRAESEALDAEAERDRLPKLEALTDAVAAHRARGDDEARIAKGVTVVDERGAAVEAAKDALHAAGTELEQLEQALADAQHRHAHAELRSSLRVGEPCPVCEQAVAALPPKLEATELTNAKKAVAAQKKVQQQAQSASANALAEFRAAQELLESLRERTTEYAARIEVFPDAEQAAELLTAARRADNVAQTARSEATKRRAHARAVAKDLARFDDAARKAEAVMEAQRKEVIAAGLDPPAGDWADLVAWADDARPEQDKRAAEFDEVARAHAAERDALFDDLATRARDVAVPDADERTLTALTLAIVQAHHNADERARRVEEQLARAAEIDAVIASVRAEEQVAGLLGTLLDKRHFGQWMVDEALQALVAGASVLLEQLSGGQYALTATPEGDLLVIDHANADETRSVRSLSGGETFQASLALALALADRISELAVAGAAALESIFLDEGFGTLDPETLDVVAGTIESLGHGERVVGVVTHVADLAERMPVRFRVHKEGRTSLVTREET